MPRIQYREINFGGDRLETIRKANELIVSYGGQGYTLTLRQLYYQFVARAWIANKQKEYKRLGDIINDGRLAGLIDWEAIEDRTRELGHNSHWSDPSNIIQAAAQSYAIDKWEDQPYHVEVWVEKDALEGVVGRAAKEVDVNYFSCRGYTSQTAMWNAGRRLAEKVGAGKDCVVLHLGDHDPSGIDMSRDIEERLRMFMGDNSYGLMFERIALNEDQIEAYNPPPNPAKITDSRYEGYRRRHGEESWELDALDPAVIHNLIQNRVISYRNDLSYNALEDREYRDRCLLENVARRWGEVEKALTPGRGGNR